MNDKIEIYKSRIKSNQQRAKTLRAKSFRLSLLRLAVLVGTIISLFLLTSYPIWIYISIILAGIVFFGYIVLLQHRSDRQKMRAEKAIVINQNEIDCLRSFDNLYYDGSFFSDGAHYYSGDLDVYGKTSLFGLINRGRSYYGLSFLSSWLSMLSDRNEIELRQKAIIELEEKIDWRQQFANYLFDIKDHPNINPSIAIQEMLNKDLSFSRGPLLTIYRKLVPLIWIGLASGYFYFPELVESAAILFAILNLAITFYFAKRVSDVQGTLSSAVIKLGEYSNGLAHIMKHKFESAYIDNIIQPFKENHQNSSDSVAQLRQLKRIIDYLDYRLNMIVGGLLNILLLWDLKIISMLIDWQKGNPDLVFRVFKLIGKMEALNGLATWSYNHPDYCYPSFTDEYLIFEGIELGHPLLMKEGNVLNDFYINQHNYISLITGSNMSGKSTFLRTVGVNMILAYAGTKVYASVMSCSIVQLISYMRIKDALEENVSTFKAELNRVQLILDEIETKNPCLILIDEMLRGTNSKDKLKGSIGITKKLMESQAYALIATHDIQLAELGHIYTDQINNYFFDIDFADGDLQFDYKLKKGICKNFNASYLLGQLGIEMEEIKN